ncbi:S1 RNA-binding domain-containing protein [Streptomyces sp. SID7909]|uniref:S1 RNA-binding domain-containing protein n=1 Tax=Streptomyces sp. SID7909 TaxID=2706092 RepID=UPI0013BA30D1|nr:S1 RNA-binding domain-containing protein [Streptomyces sp. SID7909]NEC06693.1 S1 RNA-binding domain-containing protein [Streptomyces sp. SID7909]
MDWQAESPELWTFLGSLHDGEILTGTVAAIERFGVFVALDEGPGHPIFPGVGFLTMPELSWRHFTDPKQVVRIGQRVTCEFIGFDTYNAEARLSLRALQPDPLRAFACRTEAGHVLRGTVKAVCPIGVFVDVGDGIVGLVPFREYPGAAKNSGFPSADRSADFEVGAGITIVVLDIDLSRRRLLFTQADGSR